MINNHKNIHFPFFSTISGDHSWLLDLLNNILRAIVSDKRREERSLREHVAAKVVNYSLYLDVGCLSIYFLGNDGWVLLQSCVYSLGQT